MIRSVIATVAFTFVLAACSGVGSAQATPTTVEGLDIAFTRDEAVPPQAITVDAAVQALRARGAVFERPPDVAEYGTAACAIDAGCLNGELRAGPRGVWLIEWADLGTGESWGKFVVDPQAGHVLGAIGEWPRD